MVRDSTYPTSDFTQVGFKLWVQRVLNNCVPVIQKWQVSRHYSDTFVKYYYLDIATQELPCYRLIQWSKQNMAIKFNDTKQQNYWYQGINSWQTKCQNYWTIKCVIQNKIWCGFGFSSESLQATKMASQEWFHLRGMNLDEWVAPIPGLPCLTGLYEIENSAR